jgi:hypothetical protein
MAWPAGQNIEHHCGWDLQIEDDGVTVDHRVVTFIPTSAACVVNDDDTEATFQCPNPDCTDPHEVSLIHIV